MKTARIHVLIAEDDAAHVSAIRRAFEPAGPETVIEVVGTLWEFRQRSAEKPPNIAVMDLNLPDGRAVEVLTHPPEAGQFPILVMTSFGNEQVAVQAIKSGALDYVVKSPDAFANLPHIVERALHEWNLLQERKQAKEALAFKNLILTTQQETSLDGILVVDENGGIISSNQRFVEIWQIPSDVVESKSDKRVLQSVKDKLADPGEFVGKLEHLHAAREETSQDEIALKDGRIFDRYSAPMEAHSDDQADRHDLHAGPRDSAVGGSQRVPAAGRPAVLRINKVDGLQILALRLRVEPRPPAAVAGNARVRRLHPGGEPGERRRIEEDDGGERQSRRGSMAPPKNVLPLERTTSLKCSTVVLVMSEGTAGVRAASEALGEPCVWLNRRIGSPFARSFPGVVLWAPGVDTAEDGIGERGVDLRPFRKSFFVCVLLSALLVAGCGSSGKSGSSRKHVAYSRINSARKTGHTRVGRRYATPRRDERKRRCQLASQPSGCEWRHDLPASAWRRLRRRSTRLGGGKGRDDSGYD